MAQKPSYRAAREPAGGAGPSPPRQRRAAAPACSDAHSHPSPSVFFPIASCSVGCTAAASADEDSFSPSKYGSVQPTHPPGSVWSLLQRHQNSILGEKGGALKGGENVTKAVASKNCCWPLPGRIISPNVCLALQYSSKQQEQLGLWAQHNLTMDCLNKKHSFVLFPFYRRDLL